MRQQTDNLTKLASLKSVDESIAEKIREANISLHDEKAREFDREEEHMYKERFRKKITEFVHLTMENVQAQNPKFLDLGCGTGNLSLKFLDNGYEVTGVDISRGMLDVYKEKTEGRARFVLSDIEKYLENSNEKYDVVAFSAVLHHLPEYIAALLKSAKLLKKNGIIFINHEHLSRDSITTPTKLLEKLDVFIHGAIYKWRYHREDFIKAILRRLGMAKQAQKSQNIRYADYHVFHGGINEKRILDMFKKSGFDIIHYETYQLLRLDFLNWIANTFKLHGLFSLIVQKKG